VRLTTGQPSNSGRRRPGKPALTGVKGAKQQICNLALEVKRLNF